MILTTSEHQMKHFIESVIEDLSTFLSTVLSVPAQYSASASPLHPIDVPQGFAQDSGNVYFKFLQVSKTSL